MSAAITPLLTATTLTAMAKTTTISSIPVRAIPVPNTNKLILAGPCIVLRTATVAEQMQALRQERKLEAAVTTPTPTTTASSTVVAASTSTATRTALPKTSKDAPQSPELLRCKRRADIGRLGFPEAKPVSVSRRNARERNRVKLVNLGFETLREHVPNGKKNRKMSKVETLRSAVEYIRQMQQMLRDYDAETGCVTEKVIINVDHDHDNSSSSAAATPSSSRSGSCSSDDDGAMCADGPLILAPAAVPATTATTTPAPATAMSCSTMGAAPVLADLGGCEKMVVDGVSDNNNLLNNNNSSSIKLVNLNKNSITFSSAGASNGHIININNNNNNNNNNNKEVSNLNFINLLPAPSLTNSGSQTFTVLTLPLHQSLSSNLVSDEVFLPNSSVQPSPILTSSGINSLSGNITTFTNLQTLASLSGTREITLSFANPVQDLHPEQQQQSMSVTATERCQAAVTTCIDQHQPQQQQQQQQRQQQLQHRHNDQQNQQHMTTMSLPDAIASSSNSLSLVEETAAHTTTASPTIASLQPLSDVQFLPQQPHLSMLQHQMQPMDQAPSPCLSTASSTSSESSYECYEPLEGSLEEDLQDISNWITELCQDMATHGDVDESPDFLQYDGKQRHEL